MRRRHPPSPLFPYTTLFRSCRGLLAAARGERTEHGRRAVRAEQEVAPRDAAAPRVHVCSVERAADRLADELGARQDRKSTRLNSSHGYISYAVICLKK